MASVASERLDQMQDPELSIEQAMLDYRRLGYSESWINQRLKSIEIRKDLTYEWKSRGLQESVAKLRTATLLSRFRFSHVPRVRSYHMNSQRLAFHQFINTLLKVLALSGFTAFSLKNVANLKD